MDDHELLSAKLALNKKFYELLESNNATYLAPSPPPTQEYWLDETDGRIKLRPIQRPITAADSEIIFLRTQLEELRRNNRWNIREDGEALIVCKSDHEKWEGCKETRYVPEELLHEEYKNTVLWKDLYNRDVNGLNNEGDAIGGEPARGMRYYVEYLRKENERLRSLLPPEPVDPQNQAWVNQ